MICTISLSIWRLASRIFGEVELFKNLRKEKKEDHKEVLKAMADEQAKDPVTEAMKIVDEFERDLKRVVARLIEQLTQWIQDNS